MRTLFDLVAISRGIPELSPQEVLLHLQDFGLLFAFLRIKPGQDRALTKLAHLLYRAVLQVFSVLIVPVFFGFDERAFSVDLQP